MIDVFGVFEWRFNSDFAAAWASVEHKIERPVAPPMTEEHAIVLHMCTDRELTFMRDINRALTDGKSVYNTAGFKFHYFYFYLVDAVQLLRQNQTVCTTSYYRTGIQFQLDVNRTRMRFGSFVWASQDKDSLQPKSNISCFEIYSCFGADISNYSAVNVKGQVLIPPYEVFEIADVQTHNGWCSVLYKLHSTKVPRADLNCKLHLRQSDSYLGAILRHWQQHCILFISVCIFIFYYAVFVKRWCRCLLHQHKLLSLPTKQSTI